MANEVYMDVPAVRNISKRFSEIGELLTTVAKALEVLILTLKTTAFMGLVGGLAVASFLESVKPHVEEMSRKCNELGSDLSASVQAFEDGDQEGATRFY